MCGYFVSVILQVLGQEQIKRKRAKIDKLTISNEQKNTELEIWSRDGTSQQSLHAKSEISQKSGTEMDQEFGHPAVDFGQAAVYQSTGMPTQRSTRGKRWSIYEEFIAKVLWDLMINNRILFDFRSKYKRDKNCACYKRLGGVYIEQRAVEPSRIQKSWFLYLHDFLGKFYP